MEEELENSNIENEIIVEKKVQKLDPKLNPIFNEATKLGFNFVLIKPNKKVVFNNGEDEALSDFDKHGGVLYTKENGKWIKI